MPYWRVVSVISVAFLLFAGLFHNVNVIDDTYQIPPNNWRYVDSRDWRYAGLQQNERPGIVRASFVVKSGPPVRLLLMDRASLDALQRGGPPTPLRETAVAAAGVLAHRFDSAADCILVLENRGSPATSTVHLIVTVDSWESAELSPERKLVVLAVSFSVFFGMVTYSAARLWKVFRK